MTRFSFPRGVICAPHTPIWGKKTNVVYLNFFSSPQAEMSLLMMDEEEESKKHFNYDKIVEHQNLSKKKKKQLMKKKELLEDDFEVTRDKSH